MLKELRKGTRQLRDEPDTRLLLNDKVRIATTDAYLALSLVIEAFSDFEHKVKPGKFKATFENKETGLSFTAEIFKQKQDEELVVKLQKI